GELAFEQVLEPGHRRRGAAYPASERMEDREPDAASANAEARARAAAARVRLRAALRRGRRPGNAACAHGVRARYRVRPDRRDPGERARTQRAGAADLADDRAAHAERLDGTGEAGRQTRRRHVALASSAAFGAARAPRAAAPARAMDAQLPARGAVGREGAPASGAAGARTGWAAPHRPHP